MVVAGADEEEDERKDRWKGERVRSDEESGKGKEEDKWSVRKEWKEAIWK